MKLSGEVVGISEATSMMAGLSVGKPDDTESISDSALETCSGFSGATSIRIAQFSEVSLQYIAYGSDHSWNKMYSTCTYHQCIVCLYAS